MQFASKYTQLYTGLLMQVHLRSLMNLNIILLSPYKENTCFLNLAKEHKSF